MKKTRDQDELLLLALVEMFKQNPNTKISNLSEGSGTHISWFIWSKSEQGLIFWNKIYNTNHLTY